MFVPKSLNFCTSDAKKQAGVYCCAYSCKSPAVVKKRGLCHKHYAIHRRIVDPVYDRYVNFKGNAKRRCKDFTITLEQFRQFCEKEGYIIRRGYRGKNCTVDRIDNRLGYHIGNIRLITNSANIRKYHDVDKHLIELPESHEDFVPF